QVCFGVGEIYSKSNFGQLSCYDRATGAAGSAVTFAAPLLSVPLRVGNQVAVADRDGEVCALQFPQGSRNWCLPTHGENNASLMFLEPGVWIYPAKTEGLLAIESQTGRIIGKWKPTQTESVW